jgi:hypothetical protein
MTLSSDDLFVWQLREIGDENASAVNHMDGPVIPMKIGRGRRVSIDSLDVLQF